MSKVLTLGEVLLRLSTKSGSLLSCSHSLDVNYGGSEANVASGLAHFGHDVQFATKVPESPLGMAVLNSLRSNGIDTSQILFGGNRIGIYFLEQGEALRNSKVIYDRGNSSFCCMDIQEWDFDQLFENISLFHISGITFALSKSWNHYGKVLVKEAHNRGIPVSFDINYRQAMWTIEEAKEVIIPILPMLSFCCANYLDARNFFEIDKSVAVPENMKECYRIIKQKYPNIRSLYSTDRRVISASYNELQGMIWIDGVFKKSKRYKILPIVDRIGSGDSFVAGILHGIISGMDAEQIVQFGTAASVLKHSVNGDILPLTEKDVQTWISTSKREVVR